MQIDCEQPVGKNPNRHYRHRAHGKKAFLLQATGLQFIYVYWLG